MVHTLQLTVLAAMGGIILGCLLAMMRLSRFTLLRWIATHYVDTIRSIPLVLMIFWFYFLLPYIGAWVIGSAQPIQVGAFQSALITFVLFEAAYYGEIIRSGIQSIPLSQVWAAEALGMNYWQTMSSIILPQAFRQVLPILLTQTIVLFQEVSLVYVISLPDFFGVATTIAQRDGRIVELYAFVAFVYLVLCLALSQLVTRLLPKFEL